MGTTCEDCGFPQPGQNPLDCNTRFMQCNNPCGVTATNTPQCESLPSQIQNFTDQFFGQVIKTEIDGKVVWSLPCSLDVGLPDNPRAAGEGLACYFLRMFQVGIKGLKGDKGNPGINGARGVNGYSVVVQGFVPPTLNNPLAQIAVLPNPALVEGLTIFVEGSGYYQITDVQPGGILFVTLVAPVAVPVGFVTSGSLVTPSGPPGILRTGTFGTIAYPAAGSSFTLSGTYSPVAFTPIAFAGDGILDLVLPASGTFQFTATLPLVALSGGPSSPELVAYVKSKFVNVSTGQDVALSETFSGFAFLAAAETQITQLVVHALVTGAVGQNIVVYAVDTANTGWIKVMADGASLAWVQIS